MSILKIEGGRRLEGRIAIEGNKNAALPLLAACLLTEEECVLSNVPRIRDVEVLLDLLVGLGATVVPIRRWSVNSEAPCCCSDRCWHAAAQRVSLNPAAIFRHAVPSPPTCRRWRRWEPSRSTSRGTRSRRHGA